MHNSPEGSQNYSYYSPDYFLINGKAGPDTSSDSSTSISTRENQTILVRLINAGYVVSLGGLHFTIVASDGRPLPTPYNPITSLKIAPGERYNILVKFETKGTTILF